MELSSTTLHRFSPALSHNISVPLIFQQFFWVR
jgi:hypothetical protein